VSGPAAGLAIVVAELVRDYGIGMLGPVLLLAGLIQLLAGKFKLGQVFRAMSPAVIYGMLAGIGVLIFASQLHVMIDDPPLAHGIDNLLAIPSAIYTAFFSINAGNHRTAALIGILTIFTLIVWDKFKPSSLKLLPGALIAVIVATIIATILRLPVKYVDVPTNLLATIQFPVPGNLIKVFQVSLLLKAITIAIIASAESLLSAAAVDRLHHGKRTDFDRELAAQGIGNIICSLLGALPMTGVIVRSSVNVEAGAKTRLSAILHGLWLLLLVVAAPTLLRMIPTSCLAAILVVTGYKLIEVKHIRHLREYGRFTLVIFFSTLVGILAIDLLIGVIIGVSLTAVFVIYRVSRFDIHVEQDETNRRTDLYMEGAATFIRLPKLASTLEQIPSGTELHVHLDKLVYIDHTCLDLLSSWAKQQEQLGSTLVMEWDGLFERYRRPLTV
jgi:MFS superfamily sulfate permease-like transporter